MGDLIVANLQLNRRDALLAGSPTYYGKTCDKHPALGGLRYTSSCSCLECVREVRERKSEDPSQGWAHEHRRKSENKRRARKRMRELEAEIAQSLAEGRLVYATYKMCFKISKENDIPGSSYWRQYWAVAHANIREMARSMDIPVDNLDKYPTVKSFGIMTPGVMYTIIN